jgi:antitoxin component of MazEF toxin-antitoxin module
MDFVRKTVRVGNSAGVILPKRLLGSEVKITVVKRPINIKKEVMKLLDNYLADLIGIYITNENPLEVLAVSSKIKEIINNERIKLSIVPLSVIKRDIKTQSKLREKMMKAKTILNISMLKALQT